MDGAHRDEDGEQPDDTGHRNERFLTTDRSRRVASLWDERFTGERRTTATPITSWSIDVCRSRRPFSSTVLVDGAVDILESSKIMNCCIPSINAARRLRLLHAEICELSTHDTCSLTVTNFVRYCSIRNLSCYSTTPFQFCVAWNTTVDDEPYNTTR